MKILWKGFCGKNHSWSICAQNICRVLKTFGHDVHLFSTNGIEFFPEDLNDNLIGYVNENEKNIFGRNPDNDYDMQLSYTAMHNWGAFLSHGLKNRFAIWNYDGTHIPKGWAKYYKNCDLVLPSSKFSYNTFVRAGVPQDRLITIPHGVSNEFLEDSESVYPVSTDRKYKFFVNIAQAHTRKNISGLLEAWCKAFSNKDDVVLIAKVSTKKPKSPFEVSWYEKLMEAKKKYKNHAPIMVVNDFIENISDLYRACDIGLSLSHVECFNLPALEMMALGKITIASNYGGNVDFMNSENSLLVNGKVVRAPMNYQYWEPSVYGEMFQPDVNHAVEQMRLAVSKYDELLEKFNPGLKTIKETYTWENTVNQILGLVR